MGCQEVLYLTVLLDGSLHHHRPKIGQTSRFPNHTLVDVPSFQSLWVEGSQRYEAILYHQNPLDILDLSRLVRTDTLLRANWTQGETDGRRGPRVRTGTNERHVETYRLSYGGPQT